MLMLQGLSSRILQTEMMIETLAHRDMGSRLVSFLLILCRDFGVPTPDGMPGGSKIVSPSDRRSDRFYPRHCHPFIGRAAGSEKWSQFTRRKLPSIIPSLSVNNLPKFWMTSAYILVLAIVVLGGLIAAISNRIGSRIGKKRMRLFNLRPKQTATLMTIVTGILIAGSTLIVLFASSKSLRQGVFELDRLLNERRAAIKDLESQVRKTTEQKNQVEKALKTAKSEQIAVQKRLEVLNKNYQASRQRLRLVSGQLEKFRKEVANLNNERVILTNQKAQLISQRDQLSQQKSILSSQINQLQTTVQARDKELANQQKLLTTRQRNFNSWKLNKKPYS
jgi:hypothetical protein